MSKSASKHLARWQARSQPRELALSDGYAVTIRPVQVANLMLGGSIPLTLIREARDIKAGAGRHRQDAAAHQRRGVGGRR